MHPPQEEELRVDAEDWEEWDGQSPFWIHCAAGSLAGVVEHTAVYPLDTVRTHIQVCASCVHRQAFHSMAASSSSPSVATSSGTRSPTTTGALRGLVSAQVAHQHKLPTGFLQTMRFLMNEPAALAMGVAPSATARTTTTSVLSATTAVPSNSSVFMWSELVGLTRLWRGVQAILIGCIPAHALYFASYETVKAACTITSHTKNPRGEITSTTTSTAWWGSSLAGAAAVLGHDMIMTPLDTIKQRMQLGYYESASKALLEIVRREGFAALYRSFPITLVSNIPYGMVMVTTHESCKQAIPLLLAQYSNSNNQDLRRRETLSPRLSNWKTVLVASSVAGFTASAVTTPLDRIKTALQTQTLAPACWANPGEPCPNSGGTTNNLSTRRHVAALLAHDNWQMAAKYIWQTEGWRGFCRGFWPRVLSHTPAVAISWTTYEMAKQSLLQHYHS